MNKKHLILTLALVAAFSAGTATALQHQNYVSNNVSVAADDTKTALTVADVNFTNYAGFAGNCIAIGFNVQSFGLADWTQLTDPDTQVSKLQLTASDGTPLDITVIDSQGAYVMINRTGSYEGPSVGTILTIKAGFTVGDYVVEEDVSYQYATANTPWVLYTDELPTPGQDPVVPQKQAVTVKDVNFTNYAGFAGNCVAIGFNVDTLGLADWTQLTDTETQLSKLEMKDKDGEPVEITAVDSQGAYVMINRTGSYEGPSVGTILTIKAGFTVGDYVVEEDAYFKYSTENTPWSIYDPNDPEIDLEFGEGTGLNNDLTWSCPAMIFSFNTTKTFGMYQSAETLDKIIYTNAYGENVAIRDFIHVGQNNFLFRWTADGAEPIYAMVGDKVTFKAGFALAGNEKLPEDVTFVVTNAAAQGQIMRYTADCDPVGLAITTSADYSQITVGANAQMTYALESGYGTAKFTSSDEAIATVTKDGLVTGVAEGTVTITATIGSLTDTFEMTILPASPIVGVEIVSPYTVWVPQNETFALPADFKAHVKFENGQYGSAFDFTEDNCVIGSVDTATLGSKTATLTVTYQGEQYTVDVDVNVYEIGDVSVKEVAIVDWFVYAIFIQYPDSTANTANITSTDACDSVFDHITYRREDGTDVPITGGYILGGGNICIMPFGGESLNEDNYNNYYLAGDVLKLAQGMKIWMWTGEKKNTGSDNNAIAEGTGMYICEGILQHDIEYRYDGNVWGVYVEYTDIQAGETDITVEAGKSVSSGVTRLPANATTGTFTYVSSDESIATVNSRGVIKGLKEGTCTITVTLDGGLAGAKTVTLNVTVTDKIVGLDITPATLTVKKGKTPDISGLSATFKWASGKAGEAVDLTNATLLGYDSETLGEQTVVLSVSVDGTTYTGTLTVVVEESGCGSVTLSVVAPVMLLGAGWIVSKKRRK